MCYLSIELKKRYHESTILLIVKSLYILANAENHWFPIYHDNHKDKQGIEMLSYDVYLFITKDESENFDIVGLQTNNSLNIGKRVFMMKKKKEIIEAKFNVKNRTIGKIGVCESFNDFCMTIEAESIIVI